MNATDASQNDDFDFDLEITKVTRRASGGGTWVCGTVNGRIPLRRPGLPRTRREPRMGDWRQPHLETLGPAAGRQADGLQLGPRKGLARVDGRGGGGGRFPCGASRIRLPGMSRNARRGVAAGGSRGLTMAAFPSNPKRRSRTMSKTKTTKKAATPKATKTAKAATAKKARTSRKPAGQEGPRRQRRGQGEEAQRHRRRRATARVVEGADGLQGVDRGDGREGPLDQPRRQDAARDALQRHLAGDHDQGEGSPVHEDRTRAVRRQRVTPATGSALTPHVRHVGAFSRWSGRLAIGIVRRDSGQRRYSPPPGFVWARLKLESPNSARRRRDCPAQTQTHDQGHDPVDPLPAPLLGRLPVIGRVGLQRDVVGHPPQHGMTPVCQLAAEQDCSSRFVGEFMLA